MLGLKSFDLDEIASALSEQNDYEHYSLVDPKTGEMVFWSSDTGIDGQNRIDFEELDPDLIAIQPLPSYIWYQDMADFAELVSDEKAGRRLARAIDGKGAFRHFKNELHEEYPELVPVWYAFRDARAQRRALEWLVDNSLIESEAADAFLEEHPEPEIPSRPGRGRYA